MMTLELAPERVLLPEADVWDRLHPETRRVIERACLSKTAWSHGGSMGAVRRLRAKGETVSPYRCPFEDGDVWHVGHVPSMETVAGLAKAIRDVNGDRPADLQVTS